VILGPLVGGVLVDHFWWGSVFLVNLPIAGLGLAGVLAYVPNPRPAQRRRPDPAGLLLSTAGLAALAYGLIEGGQDARWGRPQVWLPVIAGVAVLTLFVLVEWRSAEPSFDPRLFRDRRFAAGNMALGALFFAITGQMFYNNFYLQGARGMTALGTGVAFVPGALGLIAGSGLGARLVRRHGVAIVCGTALLVCAASFAAMALFDVDTPLLWFCGLGAVSGLAMGVAIAPIVGAVLAALPMERMGAGSAVNNTVRQVGSVLGIAALGTVLTVTYRDRIAPALDSLPPAMRTAAEASAERTRFVAGTAGRPDLVASANRAFVEALHLTAVAAGLVALAGAAVLILAFRTRRPKAAGSVPAPDAPPAPEAEPATESA